MKRKLILIIALILSLAMIFTSCSEIDDLLSDIEDALDEELNGSDDSSKQPAGSGTVSDFDLSIVPEYDGVAYYIINNNEPFFKEEEIVTKSYEKYYDLDPLGRATLTEACIGKDLMPKEEREGDLPDPTGWKQAKYDIISGKYLYNRCHLIGWQLTGEMENRMNLITGTRYFNIEGMVGFENMTADYIKETGNHVMYRVTPIFKGEELLARGILMEIYSVEDEGEGLCYNLFIYNVQPGIVLDYMTGESRLCEEGEDENSPFDPSAPKDEVNSPSDGDNGSKEEVNVPSGGSGSSSDSDPSDDKAEESAPNETPSDPKPEGGNNGDSTSGGDSGAADGDNTTGDGNTTEGSDNTTEGDNTEGGTAQKPIVSDWPVITIGNEVIPEYSGKPYYIVNNNVPFFTNNEITTSSYELYGDLDQLGRCTYTMACLGLDLMPTGEREGDLPDPTGWKQATYSCVSGRYLYNRCHLIGWQLTGEMDNRKNLITGTKYFNINGMVGFENMTADHIKETGDHVMYRVTPIFHENELVARGIQMEIYSVEDEGDALCYNLFIYNVQPNIIIDYTDGSSMLDPNADIEEPDITEQPEEATYVINKNSGKVHKLDCKHVANMSKENKVYVTSSAEELKENENYSPCSTCDPY